MKHYQRYHQSHRLINHLWHAIIDYFQSHRAKEDWTSNKQFDQKLQKFYQHYHPGEEWLKDADNI